MSVKETIFDFIRTQFEIGDDPEFTEDVNIFDYGFVDSLDAVQIINFLEDHWNIEITQKDLTLYPMNTVSEISAVVEAKLA